MEQNISEKFKIGKKWFIIGIIFSFNAIAGLIFSIGLWTEKEYKKEAKILFALTIVWAIVSYFVGKWLIQKGIIDPRQYLNSFIIK